MKEIDTASIKYSNHFIKNVILRVDIAPILTINEGLNPKIQETIRPHFPKLNILPATQFSTEFKDGVPTSTNSTILNQYQFQSIDNKRTLTFSSQFISFVVQDFKGFDDYIESVSEVITIFNSLYSPVSVNRLGLRYINEIPISEGSPFDWSGYINPDLIKLLDSELIIKEELSRIMSQLIYKKENYDITFSFGIGNSEFPNTISRKEFIIDIDCSTKEVEFDKITDTLKTYNESAVQIFENSIDTKLRALME